MTALVFLRDATFGNSLLLDTSVVVKHFRDPTAVVNKLVEYEELYKGSGLIYKILAKGD